MSRAIAIFTMVMVCAIPASAATITFDQFEHVGAAPVDYNVCLILEAAPGADVFTVTVMVDPGSPNIADIVAVYFDVDNDPVPDFSLSDFTSVSGGPVTNFASDTDNVQAGNISRVFDVGLAIGQTGLKGGNDDFQSTVFTVARKGLSLSDWKAFGIRGNSVGPWDASDNDREESAKEISSTTTIPGPQPIPAPAAMTVGAVLMGGLCVRRRRC